MGDIKFVCSVCLSLYDATPTKRWRYLAETLHRAGYLFPTFRVAFWWWWAPGTRKRSPKCTMGEILCQCCTDQIVVTFKFGIRTSLLSLSTELSPDFLIGRLCDRFCQSFRHYCKCNQPISLKLGVMIGPTNRKKWLTFGGGPVSDIRTPDDFSTSLTVAE